MTEPCTKCGRAMEHHVFRCSTCERELPMGQCGCGAVHMPASFCAEPGHGEARLDCPAKGRPEPVALGMGSPPAVASFLARFQHLSYDVTPSPAGGALGGYTYCARAVSPDGQSESRTEGVCPTADEAFGEILRWLVTFGDEETDPRFDASQWKQPHG